MVIKRSSVLTFLGSALPFAFVVVIAWLWGLRTIDLGADTVTYIRIFNVTNRWSGGALESGFVAYINFVKLFTQNAHDFLLLTSLITSIFFYAAGYIITKGKGVYSFTVFLLISPFFLALVTNVIRQGLALSVIMLFYAISLKLKFRIVIMIVGFTLGASIHLPSAVVLLPLVFSPNIKRPLLIWAGCLVISVFSNFYSPYIAPLISGKYEAYLQSNYGYQTGIRWQFALFSLFPYVVFLLINRREMSNDFRRLFDQYMFINSTTLLFNFLPYFDRFLLSSWAFMPLLFTLAVNQIWSREDLKNGVIKILFLYVAVLLSSWFISVLS